MLCLDSVSMSAARTYRARGRTNRSERTRSRIMAAVHELLAEGAFHDSTVEQVADRAGISRATLYQHFRSRLDLVDAICDTFDANPALLAVRTSVELDDPDRALAETVANTVRFWASEHTVLAQLYGVVAIDPAARNLVDRQREDRRGEMDRLVRNLQRAGRLHAGMTRRQALARLMLLTGYEAYRELREAGLSDRDVTRTLRDGARLLVAG
jgi:AcrR family transcriptional regulator